MPFGLPQLTRTAIPRSSSALSSRSISSSSEIELILERRQREREAKQWVVRLRRWRKHLDLRDAGAAITLNTDDPVRVRTSIGREYALALELGLSLEDLEASTDG